MPPTCPCGKPATRRKYCSKRCMHKFASQSWQQKNRRRRSDYAKARYRAKHPRPEKCPCGKPCTRRKYCSEACMAAFSHQAWYARNRDRALAAAKEYARCEKARKRRAEYRRKNRPRLLEKLRQWREANREYVAAQQKERIQRVDPEGKRAAAYRAKYKAQQLHLEAALLSLKLSQPSTTSSESSPSKAPKP